jgi:DNA polymerase III delta prime subunit
MGAKHRLTVWRRLTKEKKFRFLAPEQFVTLANDYDVTPAAIAGALEAVKPLLRGTVHPDRVPDLIGREIENHQKLLGRKTSKLTKISPNYSVEFLNVDPTATAVVEMIQARTTTELAALFYGPPGTGKTEFAKYVAKLLDKPLLLKRPSDLISCYVGQTEKNLANAFEEAAHEGAVLFLDEVDSFLRSRDAVRNGWEVTAINELLTQIESCRGILLASTNAVDTLDAACLRRFTFKVGFKPLRREQKVRLYLGHLSPLCASAPSEAQLAEVSEIPDLTPGDFKVVAEKARLLKEKEHARILEMLEYESIGKRGGKKARLGIRP